MNLNSMNNMSKPIVIGIGEYLWDVLPTGKKAGGAPVNFAFHASQNGAEGWGISAVGDDELGKELLEVTKAHGINILAPTVNYPTGTVNVTLVNGQPDYEICEGVAWDHIPLSYDAVELAQKASAISFGTLAQRSEESRRSTAELISLAPKDALIVYDINLRQHFYNKQVIEQSLRMSNILKINDEEIEVVKPMFALEGKSYDEVCEFFMSEFGLRIVILTGGDKFSSVYSKEEVSTIKTPKVEVVDAVGAGDAFSGAFIGSLLNGKTIREAHELAVDTAAYVCTQAGAWTPKRKNYE